jgi:hypothetical protein
MRRKESTSDARIDSQVDEVLFRGAEPRDANDREWLPVRKGRGRSTVARHNARRTRDGEEAGLWESSVDRIVTIVKDPITGELSGLLAWKSVSDPTQHPKEDLCANLLQLARTIGRYGETMLISPAKTLRYYESLLYVFLSYHCDKAVYNFSSVSDLSYM